MPLNSLQKQQITQFMGVTDEDKRVAEKTLKNSGWNLQRAIDGYFAGKAPSNTSIPTLNLQFDRYRDDPANMPDIIGVSGAQQYLTDLRLSPDQYEVLLLQTLLGCSTLATFERPKFTAGWAHQAATTPEKQLVALQKLTQTQTQTTAASALAAPVLDATGPQTAANESLFKRVYRHTFVLALPTDVPNVRLVPFDTAVEFWRLLLGPQSPGLRWVGSKKKTPFLEWWIEFLEKGGKAVNKDLWLQTLAFAEKSAVDEDLGFWEEDAAWPGVVDEFVAWVGKKRGGN